MSGAADIAQSQPSPVPRQAISLVQMPCKPYKGVLSCNFVGNFCPAARHPASRGRAGVEDCGAGERWCACGRPQWRATMGCSGCRGSALKSRSFRHDDPDRDVAAEGFQAARDPTRSGRACDRMAVAAWSGSLTGVRVRDEAQEAAPRWGPPPEDIRGEGYFGCSGRSRSVPLVGLRSGVPGAFWIAICT